MIINKKAIMELRKKLDENLEAYCLSRPGKTLLMYSLDGQVIEEFYDDKKKLRYITHQLDERMIPYITYTLPARTHKFNEGNISSYESLDEFVKYCPNDPNNTELPSGKITKVIDGKKYHWVETTQCYDCGCVVKRKPLDEIVARIENQAVSNVLKPKTYGEKKGFLRRFF